MKSLRYFYMAVLVTLGCLVNSMAFADTQTVNVAATVPAYAVADCTAANTALASFTFGGTTTPTATAVTTSCQLTSNDTNNGVTITFGGTSGAGSDEVDMVSGSSHMSMQLSSVTGTTSGTFAGGYTATIATAGTAQALGFTASIPGSGTTHPLTGATPSGAYAGSFSITVTAN